MTQPAVLAAMLSPLPRRVIARTMRRALSWAWALKPSSVMARQVTYRASLRQTSGTIVWAVHAQVGSFSGNGFGLRDVMGNVWEWCRDGHGAHDRDVEPGDGLRRPTSAGTLMARGGFTELAALTPSAHRNLNTTKDRFLNLGVRPAGGHH